MPCKKVETIRKFIELAAGRLEGGVSNDAIEEACKSLSAHGVNLGDIIAYLTVDLDVPTSV